MKKGYIFDFDGVICDTEKYHYLAWRDVAEKLHTEFTEEEYSPFRSTGRQTVISYLLKKSDREFSEPLFQSLCAVKTSSYARLTRSVGKTDLIKGIEEYLAYLTRQNRLLAVASSSSEANNILHKIGLDKYFSTVVDGTFPYPKKPDPAVFLAAASRLDLSPEECVVFEDSPSGVQAARNGNFTVVGVGGIQGDVSIKDFTEMPREL